MGYKIWEVLDYSTMYYRYFNSEKDALLFISLKPQDRREPQCIHIIIKADLLNLLNSLT